MSTPAKPTSGDTKPPAASIMSPTHATSIGEAAQKRHWVDHAARTTAVLAVLAAVSSGQYANQFSRTILAQAEASDQWSYYQAKSIKKHLVNAQFEMLRAMAATAPQAAAALDKLQADDAALVKKYDQELADAKKTAEKIESDKRIHEKQGNWFQGAFIILQAGAGHRACGRVRREPERTVLHALVRENLETFLAESQERSADGVGWPGFVEMEFRRYLDCGILANGFARVHCESCGNDLLVAFSCKRRGFCPSCNARRMHDTAAHLVDRVIPHVPVRQWVLSLPRWARWMLARDSALASRALAVALRAIFSSYRLRAGVGGRCGAITFVQRFGSALNLNVHFHCVVPDGVFRENGEFQAAAPRSDEEIHAVLALIVRRLRRFLEPRRTASNASPEALDLEYADSVRALPRAPADPVLEAHCIHRRLLSPRRGPPARERSRRPGALVLLRRPRAAVAAAAFADVRRPRPLRDETAHARRKHRAAPAAAGLLAQARRARSPAARPPGPVPRRLRAEFVVEGGSDPRS